MYVSAQGKMGGFFKIRRGTNECQFEGPIRAH